MTDRIDQRFVAAVKAMEKRTRPHTACVVIDPTNPARNGRVTMTRTASGKVYAVAFLPGHGDYYRHHASAGGAGYAKGDAAMAGARFVRPDGTEGIIIDDSASWQRQLEAAGFIVARAI